MWWKKANKQTITGPVKDAAARRIAAGITKGQQIIIRQLQYWESRMTLLQKKVVLIICCLIAGSYCALLLVNAFDGKNHGTLKGLNPAGQMIKVPAPRHHQMPQQH